MMWLDPICKAELATQAVLLNPNFEDADMTPWVRTAITGIRPWSIGRAPQSGTQNVFTVESSSIRQNFAATKGYRFCEFTFWAQRPSTATMAVTIHYSNGQSSEPFTLNSLIQTAWTKVDIMPLIGLHDDLVGIEIIKTGSGTARLDNFHAIAFPGPIVSALSLNNNLVEFDANGLEPGIKHWMQAKEVLTEPQWISVLPLTPTGRTTRIEYRVPDESATRFFRVMRP